MKIDTYNQNGEKVGTTELPDAIFGVEINPTLLHQAVVAQMANMRKVIAHAKDRSEVRGGGKSHGGRKAPAGQGTDREGPRFGLAEE